MGVGDILLARYGAPGSESPIAISDGNAYDLTGHINDFDSRFWAEYGVDILSSLLPRCPTVDISGERIGAPVPRPGKVICIGLNYRDHAEETGAEPPPEPVVFMKAPNTVVGPNDPILIPPGSTTTDYEVELAIVIRTECRYLPDEESAASAIGGYTISNDLSERTFQLDRGGQWTKGKSFETFNPLGPYLAFMPDISEPRTLELRVNGEIRQSSDTSQMIFSPTQIVWYLSQFMVLEPGDIINTGTPAGVGLGSDAHKYLKQGDVIETSISGLGTQRNRCE